MCVCVIYHRGKMHKCSSWFKVNCQSFHWFNPQCQETYRYKHTQVWPNATHLCFWQVATSRLIPPHLFFFTSPRTLHTPTQTPTHTHRLQRVHWNTLSVLLTVCMCVWKNCSHIFFLLHNKFTFSLAVERHHFILIPLINSPFNVASRKYICLPLSSLPDPVSSSWTLVITDSC